MQRELKGTPSPLERTFGILDQDSVRQESTIILIQTTDSCLAVLGSNQNRSIKAIIMLRARVSSSLRRELGDGPCWTIVSCRRRPAVKSNALPSTAAMTCQQQQSRCQHSNSSNSSRAYISTRRSDRSIGGWSYSPSPLLMSSRSTWPMHGCSFSSSTSAIFSFLSQPAENLGLGGAGGWVHNRFGVARRMGTSSAESGENTSREIFFETGKVTGRSRAPYLVAPLSQQCNTFCAQTFVQGLKLVKLPPHCCSC